MYTALPPLNKEYFWSWSATRWLCLLFGFWHGLYGLYQLMGDEKRIYIYIYDFRVEWSQCSLIIGAGYWVQVFRLTLARSVCVCQWEFILLEIRFQRPWVRILHAAEEEKMSPFDSKSFACARASILTTTNMYIARARYESHPAVV